MKQPFIPCTIARSIGSGVFFRPIKSWHSGTYAGEKLYTLPGREDGSGCLIKGTGRYQDLCSAPLSVTHRLYWHKDVPETTVSAFLSYPEGMGYYGEKEYFWETYEISDDIDRFGGDDAEAAMERWIIEHFTKTQQSKEPHSCKP